MSGTGARFTPIGLAGALALLGLWQVCVAIDFVSPLYLPSPAATWTALQRGFMNGDLLPQLASTLLRMLQGWAAASVVAVALGSLIGASARARAYLQPTFRVLGALPAPAAIPVAIALFGLGPTMAVAVIAFGSLWPTLLATIDGFGSVEPRLVEIARMMRLRRFAFIAKIASPNAVPGIIAALRVSLAIALFLTVACEMIAGRDGLGSGILTAARTFRTADLFAGMALLGVIGFVGNYALALAERRLLAWRG